MGRERRVLQACAGVWDRHDERVVQGAELREAEDARNRHPAGGTTRNWTQGTRSGDGAERRKINTSVLYASPVSPFNLSRWGETDT